MDLDVAAASPLKGEEMGSAGDAGGHKQQVVSVLRSGGTCALDPTSKKQHPIFRPCNNMSSCRCKADRASVGIAEIHGSCRSHECDTVNLSHSDVCGQRLSADLSGKLPPQDESRTVQKKCYENADERRGQGTNYSASSNLCNSDADGSSLEENNQFFHNKKLDLLTKSNVPECDSTAGSVEESESLRVWREMKQNGFLSRSLGRASVPKPLGKPVNKRKDGVFRNKTQRAPKKPVFERIPKVAAPTGLLSGLNPGIINHVRNAKQVRAIMAAILQLEKPESQNHHTLVNQIGRGFNGSVNKKSDHIFHGTESSQHNLHMHNFAKMKLSSYAAITSNEDLIVKHHHDTYLSLKAASVASQWLDLLEQDITGRLSALNRSRKRVRNALLTELPYIVSTEFVCGQAALAHNGSSREAISEIHLNRWKSQFSQMDEALSEEGRTLEIWLRQLEEMKSSCEQALKYFGAGSSLETLGQERNQKSSEASEREHAVNAAAASIYSTCNLALSTNNVPYFP